MMMETRRWVVLVLIAPMLVGGAVYVAVQAVQPPDFGFIGSPGQPVPGTAMSIDEAVTRVGHLLPVIPDQPMPDPCTGEPTAFTLLITWGPFGASKEHPNAQVGMNYASGVWVSVEPAGGADLTAAGELPPIDGGSNGHHDDSVRGHSAWTRDLAPGFSCEMTATAAVYAEGASESATSTSSPERATATKTPDAVMYDPRLEANINWVERDLLIGLAGPYDAATLRTLAQSMEWRG